MGCQNRCRVAAERHEPRLTEINLAAIAHQDVEPEDCDEQNERNDEGAHNAAADQVG